MTDLDSVIPDLLQVLSKASESTPHAHDCRHSQRDASAAIISWRVDLQNVFSHQAKVTNDGFVAFAFALFQLFRRPRVESLAGLDT